MKLIVRPSRLRGDARIPASKSHTVRAAVFGALAKGRSVVRNPLDSLDARAARAACEALGARFEVSDDAWTIEGTGGDLAPPENVVDVMNSGTTLYVLMATAALIDGFTVLTGDDQIRRRPAAPLLTALQDLGARAFSTRGNGCCPIVVGGPMKGGEAEIDAVTSQYVTAVLINAPLAKNATTLTVKNLNEAPYIRMTIDWLRTVGARVEATPSLDRFEIPGGQSYRAFEREAPADFSSATFFLGAGAVLDGDLTLLGLDMNDSQGDKAVIEYLRGMGARIDVGDDGIRVRRGKLDGTEIDLNATPDALPMMAVVAALASGTTRLVNCPQARVKETDRIAVIREELEKLGADIEERADGLVINGGALRGARVSGHGDHRVVMALAVAGLAAKGETEIDTAESVAVTFPGFVDLMRSLGADIEVVEEDE